MICVIASKYPTSPVGAAYNDTLDTMRMWSDLNSVELHPMAAADLADRFARVLLIARGYDEDLLDAMNDECFDDRGRKVADYLAELERTRTAK